MGSYMVAIRRTSRDVVQTMSDEIKVWNALKCVAKNKRLGLGS